MTAGILRTLVLSLSLVLSAVTGIEAQQSPETLTIDSGVPGPSATVQAPAADISMTATQGLPRRAPQPRTLHEFWPAFAVLAGLWVAMLVYVVPMGGPLRRIVERLTAAENRAGGR